MLTIQFGGAITFVRAVEPIELEELTATKLFGNRREIAVKGFSKTRRPQQLRAADDEICQKWFTVVRASVSAAKMAQGRPTSIAREGEAVYFGNKQLKNEQLKDINYEEPEGPVEPFELPEIS